MSHVRYFIYYCYLTNNIYTFFTEHFQFLGLLILFVFIPPYDNNLNQNLFFLTDKSVDSVNFSVILFFPRQFLAIVNIYHSKVFATKYDKLSILTIVLYLYIVFIILIYYFQWASSRRIWLTFGEFFIRVKTEIKQNW